MSEDSVKYNKSFRVREREKYLARKRVEKALEYGKLYRKPCEKCGSDNDIQAHHDDYSKPLEVRWLCRMHHLEHHGMEPKTSIPSPTEEIAKSLVIRDGAGGVLYYRADRGVWTLLFAEREIGTRRGLIRSLKALAEKEWTTKAHILETIALSHECVVKD